MQQHHSTTRQARFSAQQLALVLLAGCLLGVTPAAAANWKLVGWNNLGMHCMDADYQLFSILPPYNTIHAQLIDPQGTLITDPTTAGLRVTYEAVSDPTGSINTTSAGKTNFWDHTRQLFGAGAPTTTNAGLAGKNMPGSGNVPQVMTWDPASKWFIAEGIPITPYDDAGHKNYYPMMRLVARDSSGSLLASLDIVLPVSDEMNCKGCHSSDSTSGAVPSSGWAHEADPERDFRLNVLRLHDDRNAYDPLYQNALAQAAYDPSGLEATARGGTSILCASCHLSEALPGSGRAGIKPLTQAIHSRHQWLDQGSSGRTACYQCHPGSATRCLRGAMGAAVAADGTLSMQCQSCHGTMAQVASPNRTGWLNEPSCQSCHSGTATNNNGQIRYTSIFDNAGQPRVAVNQTFATNSDTPAAGLNLYRFSTGHGGVKCEGCHGSTHAEFPALHPNDNIQSIEHQGHVGMLAECTSCHATQPNTVSGGPHGMHPVGSTWVQQHPNAVESGGASQCQGCHGQDYRGTVLSRSQGDRMLSTEFGTKYLWRGFQVGCYTCHQGPSSENANPNRAAVVSNASISTPINTPAGLMLRAADADGNALTLRIVTQPSHGTVGLIGKQATFFPDAGFSGSDAFTFAAWDGSTDSNLGTVSVSVGGSAGPTATPTASVPPVATSTATAVRTPTRSTTASPTAPRTSTPTLRRTSTPTTPTVTPRRTSTPTPTLTATQRRTSTPTPTLTATQRRTSTPTPTLTATQRRTSTPTLTPTLTATLRRTSTPTRAPQWTRTPTPTPRGEGEGGD